MAYPETCFQNLVGIRGTCEPMEAVYWVDDVPGIDISKLANVAESSTGTGEKLGKKLIESAARFVIADTEAIYDSQYKVQNSLVSGCSNCSLLTTYEQGPQRGILIKDNTKSNFSRLLIDKLFVQINATGTFNIVIDDGSTDNLRTIEHEFQAGYETEFRGINYVTKKKAVKVYMLEEVPLAKLSCPRTSSSGCGCSGASAVVADLIYTGLTNGVETQNAFGFKPCAVISCDPADLLCFVAHSAPRMIGMALLFKTAQLYFESRLQSMRNNKVVGTGTAETFQDAAKYADLYKAKLNGIGTRGVKDIVFTTLQQVSDECVVCNSLIATAWATG